MYFGTSVYGESRGVYNIMIHQSRLPKGAGSDAETHNIIGLLDRSKYAAQMPCFRGG